jgi:phage terminase large subunit-like protein
MKQFNKYVEGVLSGKIVACEFIKLAVQRHVDDLKKDWGYMFDEDRVKKAIQFAELCRHWKGSKAGERIILEPWQRFYIGSLFGWVHKESGLRRFRDSYMQVARKNGKTTMLAICSLIHLVLDNEEGAQVFCGATKEEQARILTNDVAQIILKTPELRRRFRLFKHKDKYSRTIYKKTNSIVAAIGSDSKTQDGFDPSMGNIDEFHEHKTDALLNVIKSGMGSRVQPLLNIITTAGFNKNFPCYTMKRKTSIEILKGVKSDDTFFCMIFEMDEGDDWKDKENWLKPNPNHGVSVIPQFLRDEFNKALNEGSSTEVNFKTKHLNAWVDAPETWIQDEIYLKNNHGMDPKDLEGQECYGGLDLAKSIDLNAFSLYFPEEKAFLRWFFMPEEKGRDRDNKDGVDYVAWENQGFVEFTPGNIVDHRYLIKKIIDLRAIYDIKSIAFDRYLSHHGTIQGLMDEDMELSEFGQGFVSMSAPTKEYEKLMVSGVLENFNNPVIRWMLGNVVIDMDAAENLKVHKGKSANKVDGIVSDIMALGESMSLEEDTGSYLEDGEIEVF